MCLAQANLRALCHPLDSISKCITRSRVDNRLQRAEPQVSRAEGGRAALWDPGLTSGACCVRGGPARSGGLFAHKTLNAPVADLYSNGFSSCTFQNYLPAPVSGFANGKSSGSETCVASGWGTCSPWTCDSSSPWSLCRKRLGALVSGASRSGSASGFGTWTLQWSSRCHFSCEEQQHRAMTKHPNTSPLHPGKPTPTRQMQAPQAHTSS